MDVNGSVARDRRLDAGRRRAQRRRRRGALRRRSADHRRRPLRARARVPQPDHQRHPGHEPGGRDLDRDVARGRPGARSRHRHGIGDSRRPARPRSSTISSPPSAAASASASRSPSGSSSSSTARSRWRARSAAARRSRCASRRATAVAAQAGGQLTDTVRGRTSCSELLDEDRQPSSVDERPYPVRYFELRTDRGLRRYSAEILLGPGDRIILDDDSVTNLEARTARLVPATVYSRRAGAAPRRA